LEGQNITSRKRDHRAGIGTADQLAKSLHYGKKFLCRFVIWDNYDGGALGSPLQQNQEQVLCRGGESGDTDPPRALFQVGGYTVEGRQLFRVRKKIADERKNHCLSILTVLAGGTWG